MNLNTIVDVKRPTSPDQIGPWRDGKSGRSVVFGFGSGCSEVPVFRV